MQTNSTDITVRFRAGVLATALGRIAHIASEGKSVASGHALVQVAGGVATLTAVNPALSIRTQVNYEEGPEQALFTVQARKLLDFAKTYAPTDLITVSPTDGPLKCAASKSKFSLLKIGTEEIVRPTKFVPSSSVTLASEAFQAAAKAVRAAMPKDDVRTVLNGALLRVESGRARLTATDGHRLHECYIAGEVDKAVSFSLVVPRQVVLEADHLCKAAESITIQSDGQRIRFSNEADALLCKALPGNFPPYENLIPKIEGETYLLPRAAALAGLASIRATLDDSAARVELSSTKDGWVLSSAKEGEEASITLDSPDQGPVFEAAYRQEYLADALSSIEGDNVRVHVIDAVKPLVVMPETIGDMLILVMPMR